MVASFVIGEPNQTFVKLKGKNIGLNGESDRENKPICLDLARGSNAAGRIRVPENLPAPPQIHLLLKIEDKQEDMPQKSKSSTNKRQLSEQESSYISEPPKKTKMLRSENDSVTGSLKTSTESNVQSETIPPEAKKLVVKVLQECTRLHKENEKQKHEAQKLVVKVLQECTRLHKENEKQKQEIRELQELRETIPPEGVIVKIIQECARLHKENEKQKQEILEFRKLREKCHYLEERVSCFHEIFKNKKTLSQFLGKLGVSTQ